MKKGGFIEFEDNKTDIVNNWKKIRFKPEAKNHRIWIEDDNFKNIIDFENNKDLQRKVKRLMV